MLNGQNIDVSKNYTQEKRKSVKNFIQGNTVIFLNIAAETCNDDFDNEMKFRFLLAQSFFMQYLNV